METKRVLRRLVGACAAAAVAAPTSAMAEPTPWSVAGQGSGAAPLNGPYDDQYGVGFMGGLGVYHSLASSLGLGMRVDGGRIGTEEGQQGSLSDGGLAFGAVSPALRFRPLRALGIEPNNGNRGLYLEAAGGAGLLEDQVQPVVAPSAGYLFDFGAVGLGPTARYLQVVTGDDDAPNGEDVRIMTVGLELVFLDQSKRTPSPREEQAPDQLRPPPPAPVAQPTPPPPAPPREEEMAPSEVEPVAGREEPTAPRGPMSLDEQVFFDTGATTLTDAGKEELDRIAQMYRDAGEREGWTALHIFGYADQRGPESYNLQLSRERAEAVRDYLVAAGVPASLIDVTGFGEQQPIVADPQTPDDLEKNRRVQFQIERGRPVDD